MRNEIREWICDPVFGGNQETEVRTLMEERTKWERQFGEKYRMRCIEEYEEMTEEEKRRRHKKTRIARKTSGSEKGEW